MTSREWLEIYGLDSRKLGLYDVLSGVAFKHLDGVINVMERPDNDDQTDAVRICFLSISFSITYRNMLFIYVFLLCFYNY